MCIDDRQNQVPKGEEFSPAAPSVAELSAILMNSHE